MQTGRTNSFRDSNQGRTSAAWRGCLGGSGGRQQQECHQGEHRPTPFRERGTPRPRPVPRARCKFVGMRLIECAWHDPLLLLRKTTACQCLPPQHGAAISVTNVSSTSIEARVCRITGRNGCIGCNGYVCWPGPVKLSRGWRQFQVLLRGLLRNAEGATKRRAHQVMYEVKFFGIILAPYPPSQSQSESSLKCPLTPHRLIPFRGWEN